MSVFCRSSSTSGTIVSKLAPHQVLSFLYPIDILQNQGPRSRQQPRHKISQKMLSDPAVFEAWFLNSLATAGHCSVHNPRMQETYIPFTPYRPDATKKRWQTYGVYFRRHQHTQSSSNVKEKSEEPAQEMNRTREQLMALVDEYSGDSIIKHPVPELRPRYQPADGPHLMVSDKVEDEWPPPRYAWPADLQTKTKLKLLESALRNFSTDPEEIYLLYRELPTPRAPYLESRTRHKLLRHLAVVEQKDERSMLRYLSVVDDMKVSAIPLSTSEWTSAISFAARYVARSTAVEVESALLMWREMEHTAGVKGNDATFNVLFDVACKAGKFILAEMIYKEMISRGFEFTRFHHVSRIHYYGLRGDGDGARAAYKALVEGGEIVDTVVLNAMISALIGAQEANAAENIYVRMKKAHIETSGSQLPPRDYKTRREINLVLMKMAKIAKVDPDRREEFQRKSIVAPDIQTYRILINHFAIKAGELDKAAKYLDEMKWFKLPLHGALFLALLKGFAIHGGGAYTHWTEERLESVWRAFLEAIDSGVQDLYISKWIITWALKAFAKCAGKAKTIDVWEDVKQKWDPGDEDLDFVMSTLRPILDGEDMLDKRNDWVLGSLE